MSRARSSLETPLAIFTLVLLAPYAIGETYHYVAYVGVGNYFLGYFVDLIAMVLMLMGGVASLRVRPNSAAGWLAAAWAFTACLNLRAFSWRHYERIAEGQVSGEPDMVYTILLYSFVTTFGALAVSLYCARPRRSA